jgi:DNA-binding transcriptional LysR family regulator
MDTRFLESFVAVAEHGSLAEAARRLNLTAAAVAQRVRALEGDIGAQLLARSGRRVQPTEAGLAVLARARGFLDGARALRNAAAGDLAVGEFRLGAISTALTGLVPAILSRLVEHHPATSIFVAPGTSMELYRRVLEGDLDAAILVEPQFALSKSCAFAVLRSEELIVIAPASEAGRDPHALLREEPFIRYDRNHWGGRLADDYLRRAGIRPRERFELDALEAIAVMVDRGLGVSLVPDWPAPWPEGLQLAKLALPGPAPRRQVGLVWRRASPAVRLVREAVAAMA